jgi:hypothetical protein
MPISSLAPFDEGLEGIIRASVVRPASIKAQRPPVATSAGRGSPKSRNGCALTMTGAQRSGGPKRLGHRCRAATDGRAASAGLNDH